MSLLFEAHLIEILLGTLTGCILALTGAGGTIVAVPLLMFCLDLTVAEAAPIGLLAVGLAAAIGALLAFRQKKVRYRAAVLIAVTGAITSPLGVWAAQHLPNVLLTLLFSLVLICIAMLMLSQSIGKSDKSTRKSAVPLCRMDDDSGRLIWTLPCFSALASSGTITGFLSGLLGVGGGFIIVPKLNKLTNLNLQSILATSLTIVALISMTGVMSAIVIGAMQWAIAIPFCAGTILGMLLGRLFVNRLDGTKLQQGFAVLACCIAIGMIMNGLHMLSL